MLRNRPPLWMPLAILLIVGCEEDRDARLVRMAAESTQRQAEQNQELVRLNREIAQSTNRLIKAEGEARQKLIALQHDLQDQQSEVGRQRDLLEADRKELDRKRDRDALVAVVLDRSGLLALGALPLILCWYLLHGLRKDSDDTSVNEILLEQVTSAGSPRLLTDRSKRQPARRRLRRGSRY